MSTPVKDDVVNQPQEEQEEMRYDDAMILEDEYTSLTPDMEAMLASMLNDEAEKLDGEDDDQIVADFKEAPFDEEEFMSHIVLNDEPE
eukprot:UN07508